MSLLGIALTPLVWIRYEFPLIRGRHHATRRAFAVLGFACLFAVLALIGGYVILGLLGID